MKRYYFNKVAVLVFLLLAICISVVLVFSIAEKQLMSSIDVFFSLLCLVLLGYSLKYSIAAFRNLPALVVNNEGIFDYQSGLTFHWRDIQSYRIHMGTVSYINLQLNNPERYIETIRNPLFRWFKQAFKKHSFNLNISMLTEQNERILDQIEYYDLEFQRSFMESL